METQDIQQNIESINQELLDAKSAGKQSLADVAKIKHLMSDGVYIKAYSVPSGMKIYNKTLPNDHITILGKGEVVVESPEGSKIKFQAPAHFNFSANTRYSIVTLTDCVWYCIHPTHETDISVVAEQYR